MAKIKMKKILQVTVLIGVVILCGCRTHFGLGVYVEKGYGSQPPHQRITLPDTP